MMALNIDLNVIIRDQDAGYQNVLRDLSIDPSHSSTSELNIWLKVEIDLKPALEELLVDTRRVVEAEVEPLADNNQQDSPSEEDEDTMNQLRQRIAELEEIEKQRDAKIAKLSTELDAERKTSSAFKAEAGERKIENQKLVEKIIADQSTVRKFCEDLDEEQVRLNTTNGNNAEHDEIRLFINKTLKKAWMVNEKLKQWPEDGVTLDPV